MSSSVKFLRAKYTHQIISLRKTEYKNQKNVIRTKIKGDIENDTTDNICQQLQSFNCLHVYFHIHIQHFPLTDQLVIHCRGMLQ
ncbi:hypothetical protein CDL12_22267 [Handroanthus impetiginosus]|uniref:Uncharacterized protein n=1 Tax=Handroanthus impetiginosus TaxID=429701 RepID=A0A2G9GJI2_9LAMI|nr:hypothetical protein CDL12_22267 [Handroanthus impetiginosus]